MKNLEKIKVGDCFYHDNYSIRHKHAMPDIRNVKEVSEGFMTVTFDRRSIATKPQVMSIENVWADSNRNSNCKNPTWIFLNS